MKKRKYPTYKYICYFAIIISACIILPLHPLFASESIHDIQLMTENYPPYNYSENGENKGIFVDILIEISHRMNTPITQKEIKLLPWARAYRSIRKNEKQCLFGMGKSAERASLFKWVGPVLENNTVIIAKSNRNIKINSAEDMTHMKVGVVKDDLAGKIILAFGVNNSNIHYSYGANAVKEILIELDKGLIDVWVYGETPARWLIKKLSFSPSDYKIVYSFKQNKGYFAFSKDISDQFISLFQKHFNAILSDGTLQRILDSYLSNELNSQ